MRSQWATLATSFGSGVRPLQPADEAQRDLELLRSWQHDDEEALREKVDALFEGYLAAYRVHLCL